MLEICIRDRLIISLTQSIPIATSNLLTIEAQHKSMAPPFPPAQTTLQIQKSTNHLCLPIMATRISQSEATLQLKFKKQSLPSTAESMWFVTQRN
jgi:hypothetical protein